MTSRTKLKRKEVDDVLGGEDQWKHADSTNGKLSWTCLFASAWLLTYLANVATCPKCDNGRAYFYQLQIRSADEPMTTCMCTLVFGYSLWLTGFSSIVYRYVRGSVYTSKILTNAQVYSVWQQLARKLVFNSVSSCFLFLYYILFSCQTCTTSASSHSSGI